MRWDWLRAALLGVAVLAFYVWSGHFWIDPIDEGYFLDLADRVRNGALPYRDFSTYYTPGIFYVFALTMKTFGVTLLPIRYLMAGLRTAAMLLTFRLTGRVAPWPWTLMPVAVLLGIDHWPIEPEPHPSWPSIVACLLTIELVSRHYGSSRRRWLVLAGAAAAIAFAFKQNVGAFTAIGIGGYIVLRPRAGEDRLLARLRLAFAGALGLVVTLFLWPGMDLGLAVGLWLPVLVTVAAVTLVQGSAAGRNGGATAVLLEGGSAAAGFAVVTAAWLVPLGLAIGPREVPFGLFLGSIDPTGLATRFPGADLESLHVYLPAIAAWAAVVVVLSGRATGLGPWYLLFGSLTMLAIYPRSDSAHALVSSPPILVAGAWALSRLRRRVVVAAVVGLVALAVVPEVASRWGTAIGPDEHGRQVVYAPLGLERGPVQVEIENAQDTRGVVDYVRAGTPPGAPLFVYPAVPLLNFLADRPSPSRFDHFLPGTLSVDDLQTVIAELQGARPRYVIWDHLGVRFWKTDPANRPLSDYLWRCYHEVAAFHLYLVLERNDGC